MFRWKHNFVLNRYCYNQPEPLNVEDSQSRTPIIITKGVKTTISSMKKERKLEWVTLGGNLSLQ